MSPATQPTQPSVPAAVIILAAGEGTRMKSSTPKVLHPVMGRSLLGHVVAACAPMGAAQTLVVVGHGREAVTKHLAEFAPSARAVEQREQNGTGHAVRVALDTVPDAEGTVLVVLADTPLLTTDTLMQLVTSHEQVQASATVLTARLADPMGYGRIVRSADGGNVTAIVEHRDADEQTRAIDEVNSGIFAFDARALRLALGRLTTNNSQGEEYLTDVVALLAEGQGRVDAVVVADADEVIGVNDRVQLAAAASVLQRRINESWMRAGVTIVDPASAFIGVDVTIAADAVIAPWTVLEGTTHVGANAVVGPGAHLANCTVDEGATVRFTTGDQAVIGPHASAGPYTYLRPGTHLGRGARAGAFVETKNALVGDGSKVPHLSYVGDAEIGEGSNIGAATVFVNYDGVEKHRTVIGDHVRIGSDTMLVAPVTVGDGAYTAAGSVITDDVPPGAMGVARARQRTIRDWVLRRRSGTASADAALAAQQQTAQQAAGPEQDQPGSDTGSSAGDNDLRNGPSSEGTDA